MQWQLDFWTTDFSYFKRCIKFIILAKVVRGFADPNNPTELLGQATKPQYTNESV